ncbi:hypothetical protein KQX54_010582 [Cotesia glomerata]|uniref:Uncharacterized protein n=2 Tax=Cotesia glomerata TaxID=32391 RepID=A0AAV7I445_COTGL|nr:hypothetical protein KQX54_010582 [Cotesia glomerata]
MKYALVQLPRDSNRRSGISLRDDGENKLKCIILHLSDIREELEDPQLRLRIPKIKNPSALESSTSEDEEVDLTKIKRRRKNKKQNIVASKKQGIDEILKAYQFNSEIKNTEQINDNNIADSSDETVDAENENMDREINDVGNGEQLSGNKNLDLPEQISNGNSTIIPETYEGESLVTDYKPVEEDNENNNCKLHDGNKITEAKQNLDQSKEINKKKLNSISKATKRDLSELTAEDIGDVEGDDHNLHDGNDITKIIKMGKGKFLLAKENKNPILAAKKVTFDVTPGTSKNGKPSFKSTIRRRTGTTSTRI